MIKPDSLRTALVAALPEFSRDPQRLRIFIDKGRLVSRLTPDDHLNALGYEWRYRIRIELHDLTSSPDAIAVPLLLWLRQHQPERLLEFAREDTALGFAADIIDATTWDVVFDFELNEAVSLVPREGGGWDVTHLDEPVLDELAPLGAAAVPLTAIWLGDQQIVP